MKAQHLKITGVADYFAAPVLSNSRLKGAILIASPETLRTGQLLHLAVYEPQLFSSSPEAVRFQTNGLPPVDKATARQISLVLGMATAARANPLVSHFLASPAAVFEREIYALLTAVPGLPNKTTIPFRMKADGLLYTCPALLQCKAAQDLKSTACKTKAAFLATFDEYGYWMQAHIYKLITGAKKFYFIGVSKSEPHQTFTVDTSKHPEQMAEAKRLFPLMLRRYLELNPGYLATATDFVSRHTL